MLVSILGAARAQEATRIEARIGAWNIEIDYTSLDDLPEGKEPYTRVKLSSDLYKNKATMKAPFRAYFALWDHLNQLSEAEPSEKPVKLPEKRDGAILHQGNTFHKLVLKEQTGLLIRLWLDIHQNNWDWNLEDYEEKDKGPMGWFGYQLKTTPFPADGTFKQGAIPIK